MKGPLVTFSELHIEVWWILNALGLGVRHWLIDQLVDYKELAHIMMMEAAGWVGKLETKGEPLV